MKWYDSLGSGYDTLHGEEQRSKLRKIKTLIHPIKCDTLLDVGCGSGISSDWDCHVVGIDPSKKLIDTAIKKFPRHAFLAGKAEALPFQDSYFDYVICVSAVHHFELGKAIREMKRVGKNTFVLTVLKKSPKYEKIMALLKDEFTVKKRVETQWDSVVLLNK